MGEWFLRYLPVALGVAGSLPFFYQVWRDRKTRQVLETGWSEALDLVARALLLIDRYLILDSDVDKVISERAESIRRSYETARARYAARNGEKNGK